MIYLSIGSNLKSVWGSKIDNINNQNNKLDKDTKLKENKKDWAEADKLRNKIDYYGWIVEDSKEGFRLKKKL